MAQRWNAATFSEQIQGAVALGRFQNPTECEHIRRLPCGQLLRAAVAEELRHRDLQVPNRKRRRASTSASTRRPGLAARRSAPARPRIKSPIAQPEMPERTHATATPRPAVSIGSRRTVPIAARRRRRIETAGRGAALARTRKRGAKVETRPPFRADSKSGRARPIPKSNRVRAHPKAAPAGQLLRAAVAEELRHRRSQSPKQKTAAGLGVGQHPATRIGRAPFGARTPTDQEPDRPAGNARAHTRHSHPSASGFDRLAPNSPHSCAPAPPDRNPLAEAPPSRTRKRWRKGGTRPPFPSRFKERSRSANSKIQQGASTSEGCACGQLLRAAVAEELRHRRISKSQTENGGGPRRRPAPATRIGRAPFGARTPTDQEPDRPA